MNFRIEIEERSSYTGSVTVVGFANSSSSSFEKISLGVTKDHIRCGASTCVPTNHAEEYIELYYQVLQKAKEIQEEMSK